MNETLYVDLDGTLVKTDTLLESLVKLSKEKPRLLLHTPMWLRQGKAGFKAEVARHVAVDAASLPYNQPLVSFLGEKSKEGTRLVLATAAHRTIADAVAKHIGLFDAVHASTAATNLSGQAKLAVIQGESDNFVYAGNATEDLKIWKVARAAIVVGPRAIKDQVAQLTDIVRWFAPERSRFRLLPKALRVHQWTKNLLVFLPLALAHQWTDFHKIALALWTFVAFSMVASGVYLMNDLFDLESDRRHPDKCRRPLASGDLSIVWGVALGIGSLMAGFGIAAIVSSKLLLALTGYFLITTFYSMRLKKVHILDGFTLATLYSWRVLTGGKLTEVRITFWFIAFCMFFFLSLAFAKRVTELMTMSRMSHEAAFGRGYRVSDLDMVRMLGVGSGIASIIILTMYMNHPGIQSLYTTPSFLLGAAIAIFYWICRLWVKTDRHEMHSDPIVFAIKDPVSYAVLGVVVLFGALAKFA